MWPLCSFAKGFIFLNQLSEVAKQQPLQAQAVTGTCNYMCATCTCRSCDRLYSSSMCSCTVAYINRLLLCIKVRATIEIKLAFRSRTLSYINMIRYSTIPFFEQ